jgi:FkbH-like protein
MKLTEALLLLQKVPPESSSYELLLVCGFTPLHLQTFLAAHLQDKLPGRKIVVRTGLYGDIAGTLEAGAAGDAHDAHGVALALEFFDLDPRLGYRSAGSWDSAADIVSSAQLMLGRIEAAVERLQPGIPVAICLPTLPLPPLFHPPGWQASAASLDLEQMVLDFARRICLRSGCSLVQAARLAQNSPPGKRHDFKADLLTGLPYTLPHADAVGDALAYLLAPPAPKKGIITDLDDTLWSGIVGEVGPEHVAWDLASHRQSHGLYQKLLNALVTEGVLIAVASKNDPAIVARAFEREDLLIRPQQLFPVEVSWNAKSKAVGRILETWNIGADSVIFVDDSPMELAEVAAEHPGIQCLLFPRNDPAAEYSLLHQLRDLCGKPRLAKEDAIRLESIRQGAGFRQAQQDGSASEAFLEQAQAVVTFDFDGVADDPRALDLVNKTNQFNLNGLRVTPAEWQQRLKNSGAVAATVSYQDRFGPLGKIAVFQGRKEGSSLLLETWVMSCRAFSRRVEHQCLKTLFTRYDVAEIRLAYTPTAKNKPTEQFLATLTGGLPEEPVVISRSQLDGMRTPLYHQVTETA